jgi:hypothetical protein
MRKMVYQSQEFPSAMQVNMALRFCLCVECCQDRDWRMSRPTDILAGDHSDLIPKAWTVMSSDALAQYQFAMRLCEKEGIDREREV